MFEFCSTAEVVAGDAKNEHLAEWGLVELPTPTKAVGECSHGEKGPCRSSHEQSQKPAHFPDPLLTLDLQMLFPVDDT